MTDSADPPDQMRLPLTRALDPRDERYVVSDCNREAVDALSTWPSLIGGVMALCGPKGSGKSRLAQIWAERVGAVALNGAEAAEVDPMELEGHPVLLDRAADADEETLFHLFNLAQAAGGAMLMVSRPHPSRWEVDLPDLRSRLDAAMTVTLQAPDDAVLAAILEARFAERGIRPAKDVIPYLLYRIDRSAQAATRVVDRLDAAGGPVTRASARLILDRPGGLFG